MAKSKETLVSILGSSYFQPIADLIDRWFAQSRPPCERSAIQVVQAFCKGQAQEVGISDKSSTKSYIECMSQHAQKDFLMIPSYGASRETPVGRSSSRSLESTTLVGLT